MLPQASHFSTWHLPPFYQRASSPSGLPLGSSKPLPVPFPSPSLTSLPGRTLGGLLLCPRSQHSLVLLGWPWECRLRTQGVSSGQAAKARRWGVSSDLGGGTPRGLGAEEDLSRGSTRTQ